ncbi:putative disease resistance protein RGA3 [Triticum dicoccoides]|uniref:putative disease resistance protein RGA3 n=1 Tax=Triticum dicoccoides TaxID=85692 RepID=UPI001890FC74|nr:putative disease resistance protein RGA3 [Triticum dicoccoides]XP_037467214.1 putative disease resistance protein RGA3 [Triticum dicoccoides]XP_037467215.1 putative disease resistance protein RGA3 [Triticum dicoccoides]XP_037467217.1 putative disease resistance protein RGA3 [Triticum dicoccoides]
MAAALGAAATLLGKVFTMLSAAPVAAYVDSLQLGLNSEQIRDRLLHTQGLLHNAQAHGSHVGDNPALERLLEKLSRDADQAEDLLDELHYFQIHDRLHDTTYAATQANFLRHARNALRHTATSSWAACFSCSSAQDDDDDGLSFHPVIFSRKIKSVLQDMQTHCDSVSGLLGNIPSNSMAVALRRPQIGSTIIQDTLYGRTDTFEETVNRIISCKHPVSVLPIVGPGGIGKTTFVQHLYNDARLYSDTRGAENHFQVRVWVCVSTDFDVLKLTREILAGIPAAEEGGSRGVANEATSIDQLQKSIRQHLKSKRFLIVLDDIWKCDSQDQWKTFVAPFAMGEAKGSMLLVTTRFPKVADMVKTVDPLELRGLESNHFFTFFEACMFGEDNKPEHYEYELAGIARKIANKLKGSPLAAKTVGRLLQKGLSQKHWNGVLEKHQWLKQQNSDDIMQSLKISYDYLPFDLKKCFSYCGLFPEDYWFTPSEINHFWVAIGIIDSNHQADRNYLEELVDNGFIMKKKEYYFDDLSKIVMHDCYVMHDLMHELSQSVSAQECLNISGFDFRADAIPQSVRHLSINIEDRYDANFEEEMCKLREKKDIIANLRTLMIFRGYEERIAKILKDCFKEINSLRVLFIVVMSAQSFPYRFSKLIHLQYLKISSSYNREMREMSLPSTLSRFYHLKFLDLGRWRGRSDLPEDFSHLENLHDIRAESELHSNIRNVGKMKHLQELKEFHVRKGSMGFELSELGALTELEGRLIIRGLEHVATKEEATAAKLMLKRNLKELELLWGRDGPIADAGILDALQPHSNIRVLTIANQGGTVGPSWLCLHIWLTSLERLTLEGVSWSTLYLKKNSGIHQFGPRCGGAPGKCFMRLKTVEFYEMPELAEWVAEPNCCSFPSLEEIICIDCPNLRVMPLSEVCCTNLRRLFVSGCPKMSLPSMPHTSTLTDLVVKRGDLETLSYDGENLLVSGYGGALASHNLDKVEDMTVGRCDDLFAEGLDGSIVFRSVKSLKLDASHLTISKSSSSKVLNCFPALSVLEIVGGNEECGMQFPSSSSLQKLTFSACKGLVLVPVEKENGGGIQEHKSLLQSLIIFCCGKLFCRWPMGESEAICPFPASLRELVVYEEPSMKSMAVLSNLTSLTTLRLLDCSNLTVDGFNPLIVVNLIKLRVRRCNTLAADLLSEVARAKLLAAGSFRLDKLRVDDISGLLVAPICNLLALALHTLEFQYDWRMENFTEEQEKALQLLTSLQKLFFSGCDGLQSLPQGLHRLSSLKELHVLNCPEIRSMPKEGLPVSLRKLEIDCRSTEINEQIEKIKRTNPDLSVKDY